jgi:hypothetical protein
MTGDDALLPDSHIGSGSNTPMSGFTLDLGQNYQSSNTVAIYPDKSSGGIYEGYFTAQSDGSSVPNITVNIVASQATLAAGMTYPCANSQTSNTFEETSVLIHWLDGDTYYTNVQSPSCTVKITAASQTSVSATITGTIYDETADGHPSSTFSASFVAAPHS